MPSALTGSVVCLSVASWAQLFANAGNGWPHNAPWYHQLMPISCHFRDCKALQFESTHVSSAIRPLSGTSSLSNDTVRFTRFFGLQWQSHISFLFGGCKISEIESSHFLYSFVLLGNRKKTDTYLYGYCVYNQLRSIQPSLPM